MGEQPETLPFLAEGVLRCYVVDENGRDITDCFVSRPGDAAIGCGGLSAPSVVNIEAITDCQLMFVPLAQLLPLMDHPQMLRAYTCHLCRALYRHWEIKMLLYQCSAMERYQWFLDHYPGLEQVVSGKHVASFIGITPVTLSRLRHQLKKE